MNNTALYVQLACIWESTARKPGNVHRQADFADLGYLDFLMSAAAIAPILGTAAERSVGNTVRSAGTATRQVARTNANLGIILLLAPLAAVALDEPLFPGVERVLNALTLADSILVYEAIRQAKPGGLGTSSEQDVHAAPTLPLRAIMTLAAEHDLVARQYANGFQEVSSSGLPWLLEGLERFGCLEEAIIHCHLSLMAEFPDTLIARKCGSEVAQEAARRARQVLECPAHQLEARRELDDWLRADGHRRNPGTTADLVTACLFAALREGKIQVPLPWPWSNE